MLKRDTANVNIRPENYSDLESVRAVVEAAFGSPVVAGLVDRIRASSEFIPDLALVAEADGQIHGYVMISGALLEGPDGTNRHIANLSPLAVNPARQRQGIGGELMRAVVARAEELGEPLVVLEGDPDYYSRFGFEHSIRFGIEIHLLDWAAAKPGFGGATNVTSSQWVSLKDALRPTTSRGFPFSRPRSDAPKLLTFYARLPLVGFCRWPKTSRAMSLATSEAAVSGLSFALASSSSNDQVRSRSPSAYPI